MSFVTLRRIKRGTEILEPGTVLEEPLPDSWPVDELLARHVLRRWDDDTEHPEPEHPEAVHASLPGRYEDAFVVLQRINVDGRMVERGEVLSTDLVNGWHSRDALLNAGTIRFVAGKDLAGFLEGLEAGTIPFEETVSAPDRHLLADQVARGHRVR